MCQHGSNRMVRNLGIDSPTSDLPLGAAGCRRDAVAEAETATTWRLAAEAGSGIHSEEYPIRSGDGVRLVALDPARAKWLDQRSLLGVQKRLSAESRFAVCPNRSCEGFASADRLSAVKLVATPEAAGATVGGAMRGPELTISRLETRCGAS